MTVNIPRAHKACHTELQRTMLRKLVTAGEAGIPIREIQRNYSKGHMTWHQYDTWEEKLRAKGFRLIEKAGRVYLTEQTKED